MHSCWAEKAIFSQFFKPIWLYIFSYFVLYKKLYMIVAFEKPQ
jgi:hypothetical protein